AIDLTETESSLDVDEELVYDEFEMTFPVLLDETYEVANSYQVMAYPTSYMVDTKGYIQFLAMGAMEYEQMREELEKLDARKNPKFGLRATPRDPMVKIKISIKNNFLRPYLSDNLPTIGVAIAIPNVY